MGFYNIDNEPEMAVGDIADADEMFIGDNSADSTINRVGCDNLRQYFNTGVVDIGDNTSHTVLAADSGKPHIIPDLTGDLTITLPTAAAGLKYEFLYAGVAADAQDWAIDTGSDTNFYLGGLVHLDSDAGSSGDEVVPAAGDGNSNSIVNVLTPDVGTWVKVVCDGTNWILTGNAVSASVPTFADQA